ncbi:MAG: MarC family protein [Candidatus Margulisbacteria bacterium]|nr:MarC family protein [Candidatus Margulisiibacteriota bacterium]MBU1617657.1 MarC family protein [Candidatus Margulisiibacteriota bacterium]MBU1867059.1 MarC family protein [Candidatus Margulisiibacteriota bacterium]
MELFFFPFLKSLIALFIITDSPGNLPFFMGLTEGLSVKEKRSVFASSILTGFIILILFLLAGTAVFELFGITLDDFRIAGGILLFWIAIEIMLRGRINFEHKEDVGIVPLGCPLLVGPGAITASLVMFKTYGYLVAFSAISACFVLIWIVLHYADEIYGFLGKNGSLILTKISAILIAAIAIQFVREGIFGIFKLF